MVETDEVVPVDPAGRDGAVDYPLGMGVSVEEPPTFWVLALLTKRSRIVVMLKKSLALAAALILNACTIVLPPRPPEPPTPPVEPQTTLVFDVVACRTPFVDNYCDGAPNPTFKLQTSADTWKVVKGDGNGYALVTDFPNVPDSHLIIEAEGYDTRSTHISPPILVATNAKGIHNVWDMTPSHVDFDPSVLSLSELSAIRGAMWPQTQGDCGNLSIGPRPGQNTNIFATVFLSQYTPTERDCMLDVLQTRGYKHVVVGPIVDSDGYHGIWTPRDWRSDWQGFLDILQLLWNHGFVPIVFIHPDGWTFEQTRSELTPLLQDPRAQKLIRVIVPSGWEPARYEWSSCTWAQYATWGRVTLPNALVLLHTTTDVDAPVGTDSLCDDNGKPNADGWRRIVPYIHGWLSQSSAFANPNEHGDSNHPQNTNFDNWQDNFRCAVAYSYCNRFHNGYAGWPTGSAWGASVPILIYAGEYSAYWRFWDARPEAEGENWGDAAIKAGADGYLDSGRVAVEVRR